MKKINLQRKTIALPSKIEKYWFENEHIGLKNTLFHRITVPLKPFNSGLGYVKQPEKPNIVIEWINLSLADPDALDGININHTDYPETEASVYIGSAHNWCTIDHLILTQTDRLKYDIECELKIDFESEGVAKNESFRFKTSAEMV